MSLTPRGIGAAEDFGLIRIRWAALIGQGVTFLLAKYGFSVALDWLPFVSIALIVGLSNWFLALAVKRGHRISPRQKGSLICLDVLLVSTLLYVYGGHTNPFSMALLGYVILAAILLGPGWTWTVTALACLAYTGLSFYFIPVTELSGHGGHGHHHGGGFDLHLQGMLIAFILISMLVAGFMQSLRSRLDQLKEELAKRKANEEKLAALTTLSASVAHELGTPLNTIKLIVDDLGKLSPEEAAREIRLLTRVTDHCGEVLSRLGNQWGEIRGEMPQAISTSSLIADVLGRFSAGERQRVSVVSESDEEFFGYKFAYSHVIQSILRNALQASTKGQEVFLSARAAGRDIEISVKDKGIGMTPEDIRRVGEPFFSNREGGRGMGLGLFITRLVTDRVGGNLLVASKPGEGTTVTLKVPRELPDVAVSQRSAA